MWQDGVPVNASDVAFTMMYWKQFNFAYYTAITGVINSSWTTGPYTAVVKLNHASPGFLLDLADLGMIIPKHVWSSVTTPGNYTGPGLLTGDGPFSFVSRTPGVNIVLKANSNYFAGAPHYQNLVINIYTDVDAALSAIKAGTLNFFELPEGTDLAALPSSATVVDTPSTMIYYVTFNTEAWPFNNVLVRQAMAYAIDKSGIVNLAFGGQAIAASSILAPALSYWYDTSVQNQSLDDAMAENMLTAAGYSNSTGQWVNGTGTPLTFSLLVLNSAPWLDMATVIVQNLAQIGLAVHETLVDQTTGFSDILNHNYQMSMLSWRQYFDPMLFLEPSFHSTNAGLGGNNFAVFKNATVDAAITGALNQSTIQAELPYVQQIQYDIAQQLPWINLAYGQDIWSVQGFTGWQPVPRYGLWYYSTFLGLTPTS